MAVSLISTGVQYPDSTIQTTAATASVFTDGSLVFSGVEGTADMGGGGVHVLQNPSTVSGTTVIYTGSPPEDATVTTGLSQNRGSRRYKVRDIKRDFYNGGLLVQAQVEYDIGSSNSTLRNLCYSKSGRRDWTSIWSSANVPLQGAVNPYTGRTVSIQIYNYGTIYSNPANLAWNVVGPGTQSFSGSAVVGNDVTPKFVNFLDLGSQSASRFFICVKGISDNSTYILRSETGASGTWSYATADQSGKNWDYGNFVGNSTEIIAGHGNGSNSGLIRSTDSGASWGQYAFGDSASGTNNSYYPKGLSHNGTYWCAINSNNNKLVSKAMGSGTTWTQTGYSDGTYGNPKAITWNSVDSKWYLLTESYDALFTNSSSDPGTGTWALANHFGTRANSYQYLHMMALSSQSLNPYMWSFN